MMMMVMMMMRDSRNEQKEESQLLKVNWEVMDGDGIWRPPTPRHTPPHRRRRDRELDVAIPRLGLTLHPSPDEVSVAFAPTPGVTPLVTKPRIKALEEALQLVPWSSRIAVTLARPRGSPPLRPPTRVASGGD